MKTWKYIGAFVLFLMATVMVAQTKAEDKVVLAVTEGNDFTAWNLAVNFENAKSENYTAFQMDLTLPEGFVVRDNSWVNGFRMAGHRLAVQQLSEGKYRILGYSATNAEIQGHTGQLLTLTLGNVVKEIPAEGYALKLSNVIFTQRDGVEVRGITVPSGRFFSVSYELDGKAYGYQVVQEGTPLHLLTPEPKKGHTFSGWGKLSQLMPARNLVLQGDYRVNQYNLVYQIDGKNYKTVRQDYGSKIELLAPPVREGYTFEGWSEVPETMPDHEVVVTGHFAVNLYTITYMLDGEVYGQQQVPFGEKIVPLEVQNTDSLEFKGWQEVPATMPAHDLTIYGQTVPTGIEELAADQQVEVYTLDGKRVLCGCVWEKALRVLSRGLYLVNGQLMYVK